MTDVKFFTTPRGYRLAYRQFTPHTPQGSGIFFLGGFQNQMFGTKASFLWDYAQKHQRPCVLFDYFGHGQSEGKIQDGCIGQWFEDAQDIFHTFTAGKQVVLGSSMGGWLMLLLGLKAHTRIEKLVGIASAPGFTENIVKFALSDTQRQELEEKGVTTFVRNDMEYCITTKLIEDGRQHLLHKPSYSFPVHLIHGLDDVVVPWASGQKLFGEITSPFTTFNTIRGGAHNLNRPEDLQFIAQFL